MTKKNGASEIRNIGPLSLIVKRTARQLDNVILDRHDYKLLILNSAIVQVHPSPPCDPNGPFNARVTYEKPNYTYVEVAKILDILDHTTYPTSTISEGIMPCNDVKNPLGIRIDGGPPWTVPPFPPYQTLNISVYLDGSPVDGGTCDIYINSNQYPTTSAAIDRTGKALVGLIESANTARVSCRSGPHSGSASIPLQKNVTDLEISLS